MKNANKKIEFLYPAIFVRDEDLDTFQVVFPDLNIYTDGKNLSEAYLNAKDLLTVYFTYAMRYQTDFNMPSKMEGMLAKCRANETVMIVNATVYADEN